MQAGWRGLAAAACAAVSLQVGAQADDATTLRLAALVTQALPVDTGLQRSLDRDPRWPLMDRAARVQPSELQCIRARLAPEQFRQGRLAQARQFTQRHPDRVPDAVRVLEQGAAEVFAASVTTTVRPGQDRAAEIAALTRRFTPQQMASVDELVGDARHKELRELMGLPEDFGRNRQPPGQPPLMQAIALKLVMAAMDQCKVPLTAIQ